MEETSAKRLYNSLLQLFYIKFTHITETLTSFKMFNRDKPQNAERELAVLCVAGQCPPEGRGLYQVLSISSHYSGICAQFSSPAKGLSVILFLSTRLNVGCRVLAGSRPKQRRGTFRFCRRSTFLLNLLAFKLSPASLY